MKKKYLNGDLMTCLDKFRAKLSYNQERKGHVYSLCVAALGFNVPVDYSETAGMLLGVGYFIVCFLPDHQHWCLSAVYNEKHEIVEWYVDITACNGQDQGGPFFIDLYLDCALSPTKEITLLDEDELLEAYKDQVIDQKLLEHAYETRAYVLAHVLTDQTLLDDFMKGQIYVDT